MCVPGQTTEKREVRQEKEGGEHIRDRKKEHSVMFGELVKGHQQAP